jgi:Ca-activated chloride channel family protein
MSGQPIAKVKQALHAVLDQLGAGDRMGIVIYGSDTEVRLAVSDVGRNREAIAQAIDSIDINGSTYLEAGLKLGYQTAFDELERSRGKTRLMLFTDEQPNVGNTSAEGFMGLARAGSERGVGLTTIGVGVQYDGDLASKVASARGGNLFFIDQAADAGAMFRRDFRNMTSEVAHDIAITMTPPAGYAITGVFGVPAETMTETVEGAVTVTIGSAFVSTNGGGIYVSLGRDAAREHLPPATLDPRAALLDVQLSYVDAVNGESGSSRIAVPQPDAVPPDNLRAAMALVDEYLSLEQALDAYHVHGDEKAAFALLDGLSGRLDGVGLAGLDSERALVGGMRDRAAYMAGYAGEMPRELRPLALVGDWTVTRHKGVDDIARGDRVELTQNGQFITYPRSGDDEIYQDFEVNERQLRIVDEKGMLFSYRLNGDRLTLRSRDGEAEIALRRLQ